MTKRRTRMIRRAVAVGLALGIGAAAAAAQGHDQEELAKAVQNPLASLVSLPFQFNFNEGTGEHERRFFNLNLQPVVPFPGERWNVITRTIIPVNSVPIGEADSVFGVGDANLSIFLSPAGSGSVTWGVGPAIVLPTASNPELLGSGKLSLGPTGVLFASLGKWTMGGVASNTWSVGGSGDREKVNFFFAQWFLNFNVGKGWAIGTAPVITGNWEGESGNRWTIPWGLQVSKVTHFGARPASLLLGYYYNSKRPEGAPEHQVRFQLSLLFPTRP